MQLQPATQKPLGQQVMVLGAAYWLLGLALAAAVFWQAITQRGWAEWSIWFISLPLCLHVALSAVATFSGLRRRFGVIVHGFALLPYGTIGIICCIGFADDQRLDLLIPALIGWLLYVMNLKLMRAFRGVGRTA